MIAACPKCQARYRIEREKIGEAGVRLRCSRCESVFRVRAPADRPAWVPGILCEWRPPCLCTATNWTRRQTQSRRDFASLAR